MNLLTGRNTPGFAKDTVYRFMKMTQINWIRFTTILASRIIKDAILPLDSADRVNVLTIDDSMFERNRSKKVELLAKVYDHAKHAYRFGFRMLTLGWSDGNTFLPVNSILLSSENKKNRINEASDIDKRTVGYRRRKLSMEKGTRAMLTLLDAAKKAEIPAKYVLFDSWFSSPSTIHAVKKTGYDVIGMVKKTPKMFFRYNGEDIGTCPTLLGSVMESLPSGAKSPNNTSAMALPPSVPGIHTINTAFDSFQVKKYNPEQEELEKSSQLH